MLIQRREQAVAIAETFMTENPKQGLQNHHHTLIAVTPPTEPSPRWVLIFNMHLPNVGDTAHQFVSVLVHAETGRAAYAPMI
jgi:hypothetical protein